MSSRELSFSTAGLSCVDIVVAGEDGADWADDESVFVIARMMWGIPEVDLGSECRFVVSWYVVGPTKKKKKKDRTIAGRRGRSVDPLTSMD